MKKNLLRNGWKDIFKKGNLSQKVVRESCRGQSGNSEKGGNLPLEVEVDCRSKIDAEGPVRDSEKKLQKKQRGGN